MPHSSGYLPDKMPWRIYRLIRQKRFQLELFTADFPRLWLLVTTKRVRSEVGNSHKKAAGA